MQQNLEDEDAVGGHQRTTTGICSKGGCRKLSGEERISWNPSWLEEEVQRLKLTKERSCTGSVWDSLGTGRREICFSIIERSDQGLHSRS